jgi:ribosomal-protein-alanine N-acetyltransferase
MNTTGKFSRIFGPSSELEHIISLDQSAFPRPWSDQDWSGMIWPQHLLWGFSLNGRLVGFALFFKLEGDNAAHLLKICLHPSLRGQGLALPFWENCLTELRSLDVNSVFLEVEIGNDRAIGFYKKVHFKVLRRIKGFYSDGVDAQTMLLTL